MLLSGCRYLRAPPANNGGAFTIAATSKKLRRKAVRPSMLDISSEYSNWFTRIACATPHAWQVELGGDTKMRSRTIRIPTGFGKTAGIVLAWAFHRIERRDDTWPRRLVFCLPMRVLVEQTERAIRAWVDKMNAPVDVHVLMGGVKAERWVATPEQDAILVGTQDMLLSRALNRGYGAYRALWPMEHGLLHHDVLWVFDEVQLMDVGLATSAQLAAFRTDSRLLRPAYTWWMSATLQPSWLRTVNHEPPAEPPLAIPREQRRGGLFDVKKKVVRRADVQDPDAAAKLVSEHHRPGTLTLVVLNRVERAMDVFNTLERSYLDGKGKNQRRKDGSPDLRLVHSRFRGHERAQWAATFLTRDASVPETGRIIVATQVVEAGVDISAQTLITDLAPWSSLVQRFGRAARYSGESGEVVIIGEVTTPEAALPYDADQLSAADQAIERLEKREADGSPRSIEALEDELRAADPAFLETLYPYEPIHVVRRRDVEDLFDTAPDLSGSDVDVSRFIRSGEERDVTVFWRAISEQVLASARPARNELCPVPVGQIRGWKGKIYIFDYLEERWRERDPRSVVPGMTVLLDADAGGYDPIRGWTGKPGRVDVVPGSEDVDPGVSSSGGQDNDELSQAAWKTIATHAGETESEVVSIARSLGLPDAIVRVLAMAARWHDVGKAHAVFQDAIRPEARARSRLGTRRDLAKAPRKMDDEIVWKPYARRGFRHELASMLALLDFLRQSAPSGAVLLGSHHEELEASGLERDASIELVDGPLASELAFLSEPDIDLVLWLVCSHHGKVRCSLMSTPHDQERGDGSIHGVCDSDVLGAFVLPTSSGAKAEVPPLVLSLEVAGLGLTGRYGKSWGERVADLRSRHGTFVLTFLEAILRAADWRASALMTEDPES